jgi:CDP-diglyceride synthetase
VKLDIKKYCRFYISRYKKGSIETVLLINGESLLIKIYFLLFLVYMYRKSKVFRFTILGMFFDNQKRTKKKAVFSPFHLLSFILILLSILFFFFFNFKNIIMGFCHRCGEITTGKCGRCGGRSIGKKKMA